MKPITVMIVDNSAPVRAALKTVVMVYDELELAGEASSGEEAIKLCAEAQPDVILMDLIMPGMDGVSTTTIIRKSYPDVQIVGLTSFGSEAQRLAVLEAGAAVCFSKDVAPADLVEAIIAISDDGMN